MKASRYAIPALLLQSVMLSACASGGRFSGSPGAALVPDPVYPVVRPGSELVMTGSVRIELPRYRVRGSCSIRRFQDGGLRIDFVHSSLFGSYREEATIYIEQGGMLIHDLQRDEVWDSESAVSMLSRSLGIDVFPGDIAGVLLLERPDISEGAVGGRGRSVSGTWRERKAVFTYDETGRTESAMVCSMQGTTCYDIRYGYAGRSLFPEKIVISNTTGPERLSLEVSSVTEEVLTKEDTD